MECKKKGRREDATKLWTWLPRTREMIHEQAVRRLENDRSMRRVERVSWRHVVELYHEMILSANYYNPSATATSITTTFVSKQVVQSSGYCESRWRSMKRIKPWPKIWSKTALCPKVHRKINLAEVFSNCHNRLMIWPLLNARSQLKPMRCTAGRVACSQWIGETERSIGPQVLFRCGCIDMVVGIDTAAAVHTGAKVYM